MEEISDLVKLYAAKTNKELYELNSQIGGYTENAIQAFLIVVEERGGEEYLSKEFEKFEIIENEKYSIRKEVITLLKLNTSFEEINEIVESDILTTRDLNNLISETYEAYIEKKEDQNFNFKTFVLGSIGGIISCFLGNS